MRTMPDTIYLCPGCCEEFWIDQGGSCPTPGCEHGLVAYARQPLSTTCAHPSSGASPTVDSDSAVGTSFHKRPGAALMSTDTVLKAVDRQHKVRLGEDVNEAMPVTFGVSVHGSPGEEIAALDFERPWASFRQAMSLPDLMALRDAISRAIEDVTG